MRATLKPSLIGLLVIALGRSPEPTMAQTAPSGPPRGVLVDIGSHKLHIRCIGLLVCLYAEQHGKDVVGVVLADPTHESAMLYSLAAGKWPPPPGTPEDLRKQLRLQRDKNVLDLARVSRNSKFVLDRSSGHGMRSDNPELVARTVEEVIAAAATGGRLAATPLGAQAAPPTLTLTGPEGITRSLSLPELLGLPQVEVVTLAKDSSRIVFRGPTLRSLVTLVGAPTGHELRGPNMLLAILAEAADGYKVGYMLAEIDEQFGARAAIVALTQDGRPLPPADGPFRVVVSGEEHRARWIRQLVRLRVVTLGQ